jgi:aryl-alcohol dehydrogenase-like predicted oxidoreductase
MEHRLFGNTGLHVPVIGMGTWHTFDVTGPEADERNRVTDAAFETGATFFDSSPMYGEAERVLGRTLRGRRDRAIVATKVWTSNDTEARKQIAASMAFFRRHVDVFQVHNLVAWRARLDQLHQLRNEGAVRAIGVTHYAVSASDDLLRAMKDPRVEAVQVPYNPRGSRTRRYRDAAVRRRVACPDAGEQDGARAAEALRHQLMAASAAQMDSQRPAVSRRHSCDLVLRSPIGQRGRGRPSLARSR